MSRISIYIMNFLTKSVRFLLISCLSLLPLATFAAGESCAIDKWPPPKLTEYIKEVKRITSEIRAQASAKNQCSGTNGTFSNEKKFLSLLDSIDAQNPLSLSIVTDFRYNILLVANGDSRAPVIAWGQILRNLETNDIIQTIKVVSNNCALGLPYGDGTMESALTVLLIRNKQIESYYKSVVLWDPRNTDNLSEPLASEIANNYSPHSTQNCKDGSIVWGFSNSLADIAGKLMERIQKLGKKTEDSDKNWKEAIALFRGTSTVGNYNEIQKNLLKQELSRQWLSRGAVDLMIGNLTCTQANASANNSTEEKGIVSWRCFSSVVIGSENLTNWMKRSIIQATNTDEYLTRVLRYDKKKYQASEDMTKFWTRIETLAKSEDENTNEKMMTDLVDLHIRLLETNEVLQKRIPEMQENCRKWQPGISCPK